MFETYFRPCQFFASNANLICLPSKSLLHLLLAVSKLCSQANPTSLESKIRLKRETSEDI
jgi:hypothetical protein